MYTLRTMVWTEISTLLAAVAFLVILTAFVAILFAELHRPRGASPSSLPADAELGNEARREALKRLR
jgi:hypothetical protein